MSTVQTEKTDENEDVDGNADALDADGTQDKILVDSDEHKLDLPIGEPHIFEQIRPDKPENETATMEIDVSVVEAQTTSPVGSTQPEATKQSPPLDPKIQALLKSMDAVENTELTEPSDSTPLAKRRRRS